MKVKFKQLVWHERIGDREGWRHYVLPHILRPSMLRKREIPYFRPSVCLSVTCCQWLNCCRIFMKFCWGWGVLTKQCNCLSDRLSDIHTVFQYFLNQFWCNLIWKVPAQWRWTTVSFVKFGALKCAIVKKYRNCTINKYNSNFEKMQEYRRNWLQHVNRVGYQEH